MCATRRETPSDFCPEPRRQVWSKRGYAVRPKPYGSTADKRPTRPSVAASTPTRAHPKPQPASTQRYAASKVRRATTEPTTRDGYATTTATHSVGLYPAAAPARCRSTAISRRQPKRPPAATPPPTRRCKHRATFPARYPPTATANAKPTVDRPTVPDPTTAARYTRPTRPVRRYLAPPTPICV